MIPWFEWKTIMLGPLTLQVWGLFVAMGMLVGVWIITKRGKRFGVNTDQLFNMIFFLIVLGLIFSRLFHVFLYEPDFYLEHPGEILKIWYGGLSSFGGLFGAGVGFLFLIKKFQWKEKFFLVSDILSFGAVFGWMIGRIGCFMIHDHLGQHSNCPLAIQTPDGSRLDMALLEILGMIPLAIVFFVFRKKHVAQGWFTGILFVYYGVLRFILDFFRATDIAAADTRYFGLTPGHYSAIILVFVGGFILYKTSWKK